MNESVPIQSREYWFKVIEMLQQNWALIDSTAQGVTVYFINDNSGVFDQMLFGSIQVAESALRINGFRRFSDDPQSFSFLRCPAPPFYLQAHPNGPIYSSGRFWNTNPTIKSKG